MTPPNVHAAKYEGEYSSMPPLPFSLLPGILVSLWAAIVLDRLSEGHWSCSDRRTKW